MPPKAKKQDAPKPASDEKIADDFTLEEIAERYEQTLQHIQATDALWTGLVKLPSEDRSGNVGKLVARLGGPLRALFKALTPNSGDSKPMRDARERLRQVFDGMLGGQDRGKDAKVFEVELLVRRLARAEAEQRIVIALEAARSRFADDALNTGELVVEPGLRALEVARTAAGNDPEFRSLLASVLDQLGDMTKKARQHQQDVRKSAKAKPDAE